MYRENRYNTREEASNHMFRWTNIVQILAIVLGIMGLLAVVVLMV